MAGCLHCVIKRYAILSAHPPLDCLPVVGTTGEVSLTSEYRVYSTLIDHLIQNGWTIVCACPPGGTDRRFRRCLLPRRQLDETEERGLHDEVDITAFRDVSLALIECKGKLSESLFGSNALGESDREKLHRIRSQGSAAELAALVVVEPAIPMCPQNPLFLWF